MPGYIGFTPQFNPVSLQDYLAVPTMVLGEYAKAEEKYNETATKAEALKALLGERNADNEAGWRIVDNYERQLGDLADNMSRGIQGPETYRQAKNSLKFYRENMLPLESGIPAYQKELEKWNADPTMIGSKPALESYIKNPLYRAQMMSGNAIQEEAMKAAATASARRKQETKDSLIRGGKYYSYYDLTGFSPEEQQDYYLNSDSVPELKQLEDSITDKYIKQGYSDADARRYAKLGIMEGITYDRKRHDAENPGYKLQQQTRQTALTALEGLREKTSGINFGKGALEFNVGLTGRKDLKNNTGNLAEVSEDGQVIGAKKGDSFLTGLGIIVPDKRLAKMVGVNNPQEYALNKINLIDSNDGHLKSPQEIKEYYTNELKKSGDSDILNSSMWGRVALITKMRKDGLDFVAYEKAYQQLLDSGFDPNKDFRQRKVGNVPQKNTYDSQQLAVTNLENYVNDIYSGKYTGGDVPEELKTQFGYYTYHIPIEDQKDLLEQIPSQHIYAFEGMTKDKENNMTIKKGSRIDIKSLLKLIDKGQLHISYHPKTKSLIFAKIADESDTTPEYFFTYLPDIDKSLATQDYTGYDFESAESNLNKLKSRIVTLEEEFSKNPYDDNIIGALIRAYEKYNNDKDITEQAYKLFITGFRRSFLNKEGKRNINTAKDYEDLVSEFND